MGKEQFDLSKKIMIALKISLSKINKCYIKLSKYIMSMLLPHAYLFDIK